MKSRIDRIARRGHLRKADIIRGALDRYMARMELHDIRESLLPEARQKGIFSDEDVFKRVS